MDRDQRIRDPIHDLIKFSKQQEDDVLLWRLLQTPQVQRLRRVKQLGFSEFVYPGATHSRFSHVLGAMQMARRMLDVFERNDAFAASEDHQLMKRATLAAALLHDLGHGPYSHVFEEIADTLGLKKNHEQYTKDMMTSEPVRGLLEEYGVYEKTCQFFDREPGETPYSRIISSQLDCDRLDFICRDKYYTGLKSESIDLEWLFDSLRIELIPADPGAGVEQYSFIVSEKGIGVIEGFVSAYSKLYRQVYFHKTTRAVQYMVKDVITQVIMDKNISDGLSTNPIVRYFSCEDEERPAVYEQLDDATLISFLRHLAGGNFGTVSETAGRVLERDLYKALVQLPHPASRFARKLKTSSHA